MFGPHAHLLTSLIRREVAARYRGSVLGVSWTLLQPLLMLALYTFVFSGVMKARWGTGEGGHGDFALMLFSGLILHTFFAECLTRFPPLMLQHTSYVTKIRFPLQILPVAVVGSAAFHLLVATLLLLPAMALLGMMPPVTLLLFPLVLLPFVLLTLGLGWWLAALGVYLRDIGQMMGMVTTALLFLSPILYPLSLLPEGLRPWVMLNPLTIPVESFRSVMIAGAAPSLLPLLLYTVAALLVAGSGYGFFQKARRGFADVL
jgi:lipopolysaccharide transport system permease protein